MSVTPSCVGARYSNLRFTFLRLNFALSAGYASRTSVRSALLSATISGRFASSGSKRDSSLRSAHVVAQRIAALARIERA